MRKSCQIQPRQCIRHVGEGYICISHIGYSEEAVYSIGEQAGLDLHKAGHLTCEKAMSDQQRQYTRHVRKDI